MSGHDTNTIFFNKKDKNWTFRTLASQPPTPLRPITSHCFALPSPPPPPPKVVDVICVSPPNTPPPS